MMQNGRISVVADEGSRRLTAGCRAAPAMPRCRKQREVRMRALDSVSGQRRARPWKWRRGWKSLPLNCSDGAADDGCKAMRKRERGT